MTHNCELVLSILIIDT